MIQQDLGKNEKYKLLRRLIGEWAVGIAMKTSEDKAVAGCGEMTAVELDQQGINSEINTHIEGYQDYYENDLWSIDDSTGKVHLFSVTSEGETRDHVGEWKNDETLELTWRGTFEDQEMEERILAKWVDMDQFEVKETHFHMGKAVLQTDYLFKRKPNPQA